jgi:purine catabolism regulator
MLTVQQALELEEFNGAHVVAGAHGLDRIVAWVHVSAVPDAPHWLNGGELVLTTSINMPDDTGAQIAYIQAMADKGVAALAIAVGRYIDRIPDELRAAAEHNNFPLIEIPYQARFVDIARAANERISQENMAMIERALHINRVLTQLVLDGGDLKALAVTMAGLINQSISIENERFEALASHNIADVDEARRYTLVEGRTNPLLLKALEERGVLGEIRATLRPVQIPQMPDVGLEMERILAPIVVHGDIYGYLWIIADDRPLADLDRMAIESGATIAALIMFYQEAIQSAEASLKGGLLSQLIQRESGREAVLADQALRYGLDLNMPFVLMMIEVAETRSAPGGIQSGSQKLLQLYRHVDRLARVGNWRAVVGQFAGQVVILAQKDAELANIPESIHANAINNGLRIGVSAVQRGAGSVAEAHNQCRDALYITRRMSDPRKTIYFDDLGYLHTLYRAGAESLASNPHIPALRDLMDEHQADLFHTLEVYLDEGGNGVQTAERLSVHRSTLNYRLEKIESLCGVSLSDPAVRTNLQIALKLLRLFQDKL